MKTSLRLKFDDSIVNELLQCCACVGACRSRGRGRTGDAPWCPALRRDSSPDIASPSSPSTLREWSPTTLLLTGTTTPSRLCLSWLQSLIWDVVCWLYLLAVTLFWSGVYFDICDCLFCGCSLKFIRCKFMSCGCVVVA